MDENLNIFSDVVLCIHEHIQTSLETIAIVEDEEVNFRTPTKRKRGSARDLANLQEETVDEDSELSEAGENETVEEKKDRKR